MTGEDEGDFGKRGRRRGLVEEIGEVKREWRCE